MLRTKRCKDSGEREETSKRRATRRKTASLVILPKFQGISSSFLIDLQAAVPSSQHPNIPVQCAPEIMQNSADKSLRFCRR